MKINLENIKKILIIRPGGIGDVLLTTPFIRILKKYCKGAKIDYLIEPPSFEILHKNPNVDNIILFEKNRLKKLNPFVKIIETVKFYNKLKKNKYDIVFDLYCNLRTVLFTFFTFAKYKVGLNLRVRKYFYNVKIKQDKNVKYNAYYYLDFLKCIGINEYSDKLDFYLTEEDENYIDNFFKKNNITEEDIKIGINPAASWDTKRWPHYKFIKLINMIFERINNVKVIILWGPEEKDLAINIWKEVNDKNLFIAPDTTLKQIGSLIDKLDLLITNDTSIKHIAVALDTPTITIFGPTNYKIWNPDKKIHVPVYSKLDCSPCDKIYCKDLKCMKEIKVEDVFFNVKKMLKLKEDFKYG